MTIMDNIWIDVGALEDIPRQGARLVKTAAVCVALFRTKNDQVFALDDKCPHRGGPLSQGIVHGNAVTCPLHNWVINLETGLAQGADEGEVKTFVVRTEAGRILLEASKFVRNKDAA